MNLFQAKVILVTFIKAVAKLGVISYSSFYSEQISVAEYNCGNLKNRT